MVRRAAAPAMAPAVVVGMAFGAGADLPDAEPSRDYLRHVLPTAYRNYGEDLYRPYRRQIRLTNRYDYLGNFLAEGFLVFEQDERRPGESRIRKDHLYRSLSNLIIANDSYGPASWAMTAGDEVRTQLTPLTFRQAGFNGLRWDLVFPANKITALVNRGFDSSLFPTLSSFSSPIAQGTGLLINYVEEDESNPVFNLAAHWQSRVGDVLTFGATFVNQHQANTAFGSEGGLLRGSIPYPEIQAPDEIRIRIADDSPETEHSGAAVYDVFMEVTGLTEEGEVTLSSDPDSPDFDPALAPVVAGGRLKEGFREVLGREAAEYVFVLPEQVSARSVAFRAVVANDFNIQTRQQHPFYVPLYGRFEPRVTPYQTQARAPGEAQDYSNRREVSFEHGLMTGQTILGFNLDAQLGIVPILVEIAQAPIVTFDTRNPQEASYR